MSETDKTGAEKAAASKPAKAETAAAAGKPAAETEIKKAARRTLSETARFGAAGIIGGLIVLIGGAAMLSSGSLPGRSVSDSAALTAQKQELLNQLNRRFAEESQLLRQQNAETAAELRRLAAKAAAAAAAAAQEAAAAANASQNNGGGAAQAVQALAGRQDKQAAAIAANSKALAGLQSALAAAENHSRNALAQSAALRGEILRLYQTRQSARKEMAALAVLQNFQAAFNSGGPYAAQLPLFNAAFPNIWQNVAGGNLAGLNAALSSYAEGGLPDNAALAARLAPLADRLAGQNDAAAGSGLWAKAKSLFGITIRPQGAASGDNAAARLAKLELALSRGQDAAALREAQALPPAMQAELAPITVPLRLKLVTRRIFAIAAAQIFAADQNSGAAANASAAPASPAPAAAASAAPAQEKQP